MEALWYFSGQFNVYSVPDEQVIINAQGNLLPFATTCAEEPTSVEDFIQICNKHNLIILAAAQGLFNAEHLKSIPHDLPRVALISPQTAEGARSQLDKFGVDTYIFSDMNYNDFIAVLNRTIEEKKAINSLEDELKKYSDIAFTAMNSASEMGVVALMAESVQSAMNLSQLAKLTLNSINDLGMEAVIQFKFGDTLTLFPEHTSASYRFVLESVLESNSRIVSHGRFLVFSFTHVQLLIINAPTHDRDRYERMRDILAHISSIAESRARTLQVNQMLKEQQDNSRMVMMLLEMASKDNRNSVKTIMTDLSFSLRQMAVGLDLTLTQETAMIALADKALESLEGLQQTTVAVEEHFRSLLAQLDVVTDLLRNRDSITDTDVAVDGSKVELF